jgi:hypothetical protein
MDAGSEGHVGGNGSRQGQPRFRAQAAVDVGATTFGIARWQDRGLGDSTVARAGFHSSHQSPIYHAPAGWLVLAASAGPEGPGRGRGKSLPRSSKAYVYRGHKSVI